MKYIASFVTAAGLLSLASGHGILEANEALKGWIELWRQVTFPLWDRLASWVGLQLNSEVKDYLSISVVSYIAYLKGRKHRGYLHHPGLVLMANNFLMYCLCWPIALIMEAKNTFIFFVSWLALCAASPDGEKPSFKDHLATAGPFVSYSLSLYHVALASLVIIAASNLAVYGLLRLKRPDFSD